MNRLIGITDQVAVGKEKAPMTGAISQMSIKRVDVIIAKEVIKVLSD